MTNIRKTIFHREITEFDALGQPCPRRVRVAALAVFKNPFAGRAVEDLSELFAIGGELGARLSAEPVAMLGAAPVSYGKAALVGLAGDMEHGGAVIHPKLGAPMRAACGGGTAVIPSNVKMAGPGTTIDVPLGHKDNAWSFDHFDTLSLTLADAPLPDKIAMCLAFADGGRPLPRCGKGPVST